MLDLNKLGCRIEVGNDTDIIEKFQRLKYSMIDGVTVLTHYILEGVAIPLDKLKLW